MVNYMPKHAKARSRTLLWRIACSILSIAISVTAVSFGAYAYFSDTVVSVSNRIQAARYSLTVTADVLPAADGTYTLDNRESNTARSFSFTIEKAREATASAGYCRIQVTVDGAATYYYTRPIGDFKQGNESVSVPSRSVTIRVPPYTVAEVQFTAQWGSSGKTPLQGDLLTAPSSPAPTTKTKIVTTTVPITTVTTTATTMTTAVTTTTVPTVPSTVTTTADIDITTASVTATTASTITADTAETATTVSFETTVSASATTVPVTTGTTVLSY